MAVRCGARPRTVVRQSPAAGTALGADTVVRVRTASMDLDRFRGPCEPEREPGGEHTPADVALARAFYEFAADPARGAPFSAAGVWVGIEDGVRSQFVRGEELRDLEAWEIEASYAEGSGPFSALDMAAASGGYYDVSGTIPRTCPNGNDAAPPELVGLRVVTLAAAEDLVTSCMEWWAVTLFVEPDGRIAGVALRHGAP